MKLWFNFNNSESKAVVLEVLTVLSNSVGQVSVGYKGMVTTPTESSFSISHSTNDFNVCCTSKMNSACGVVVVFQLVQYCNSNLTLEWPLKEMVKLSFHQVGIHCDMCALAPTTAISIYFEAHLVATLVGVE